MNISHQQAREIVTARLAAIESRDLPLTLLDEKTVEVDFGWIFFWTSALYEQTRLFAHAVAGNAPFIVDRNDGTIHETFTSKGLDEIIDWYQSQRAQLAQAV